MRQEVFDIECYPNYFLIHMDRYEDGEQVEQTDWELREDLDACFDEATVAAIQDRLILADEIVTFNGEHYDLPMVFHALDQHSIAELKLRNDEIIVGNQHFPGSKVLPKSCNHVDTMLLLPQRKALKLVGANLHAPTIQDLPYHPDHHLTTKQMDEVRDYCQNDVALTKRVRDHYQAELDIRNNLDDWLRDHNVSPEKISPMRSHGCLRPALAERVVGALCGLKLNQRPKTQAPAFVQYEAPGWIQFDDPALKQTLDDYQTETLSVKGNGRLVTGLRSQLFDASGKINVEYAGLEYTLGLGGVHSNHDNPVWLKSTPSEQIYHYDVTSYYPALALQWRGKTLPNFNEAFGDMMDHRVAAKRRGDKKTADALKIVINSVFGKTLDPHSPLYNPELFLHITATGQFALLSLIEKMDHAGAKIIQANTDGVIVTHPPDDPHVASAVKQWQQRSNLNLECTEIDTFGQRDVNNYMAVAKSGDIKAIGAYSLDSDTQNLDYPIVRKAITEFMRNGTPLDKTIMAGDDIRDFVHVESVGRHQRTGQPYFIFDPDGYPVGKHARWYVATDGTSLRKNAVREDWSPNLSIPASRVRHSANSQLVQTLPSGCPDNLDRQWYIDTAIEKLRDLGETTHTRQMDRQYGEPSLFDGFDDL